MSLYIQLLRDVYVIDGVVIDGPWQSLPRYPSTLLKELRRVDRTDAPMRWTIGLNFSSPLIGYLTSIFVLRVPASATVPIGVMWSREFASGVQKYRSNYMAGSCIGALHNFLGK